MNRLLYTDGWRVVHDGCVMMRWRNITTGETRSQRKRRRGGVGPETCTWHPGVLCADHHQTPARREQRAAWLAQFREEVKP